MYALSVRFCTVQIHLVEGSCFLICSNRDLLSWRRLLFNLPVETPFDSKFPWFGFQELDSFSYAEESSLRLSRLRILPAVDSCFLVLSNWDLFGWKYLLFNRVKVFLSCNLCRCVFRFKVLAILFSRVETDLVTYRSLLRNFLKLTSCGGGFLLSDLFRSRPFRLKMPANVLRLKALAILFSR